MDHEKHIQNTGHNRVAFCTRCIRVSYFHETPRRVCRRRRRSVSRRGASKPKDWLLSRWLTYVDTAENIRIRFIDTSPYRYTPLGYTHTRSFLPSVRNDNLPRSTLHHVEPSLCSFCSHRSRLGNAFSEPPQSAPRRFLQWL